MQKLFVMTVLVAMGLAGPAWASQGEPPDVLLKALTSEIRAVIGDKDIQDGDPTKIADLIRAKILPLFDFARMTQIAMGHNWQLATPEQQKALTTEFQTLLVRTYAAALRSYRNQTIEFKALNAASGDVEVTVHSLVKESGVDPLPIDYRMGKTATGWKVYEITLDGMNLIANYRSTFATRVRAVGIDGLIDALRENNRQSDSRARRE